MIQKKIYLDPNSETICLEAWCVLLKLFTDKGCLQVIKLQFMTTEPQVLLGRNAVVLEFPPDVIIPHSFTPCFVRKSSSYSWEHRMLIASEEGLWAPRRQLSSGSKKLKTAVSLWASDFMKSTCIHFPSFFEISSDRWAQQDYNRILAKAVWRKSRLGSYKRTQPCCTFPVVNSGRPDPAGIWTWLQGGFWIVPELEVCPAQILRGPSYTFGDSCLDLIWAVPLDFMNKNQCVNSCSAKFVWIWILLFFPKRRSRKEWKA